MNKKLYSIILQQSLEINGITYQPGEEIEVPEWLYDRLVETYTSNKLTPQAVIDPALQMLLTEEQQ